MPCCICESLRTLSAEMWRCPAICTKSAVEINKNTALNTRVQFKIRLIYLVYWRRQTIDDCCSYNV